MSKDPLNRLFQALNETSRLLILPHNYPDPDAIASAVALNFLLAEKFNIEGKIAYKGIIGRAENKALVNYLGQPLRLLTESDFDHSPTLVLIDTQPLMGNNPATTEMVIGAVIDHHDVVDASDKVDVGFADIRSELGATSTILSEYLQAAGLEPPMTLATALFYGIKTNTMGLGRNTDPADVAAYHYLQPRIDGEALAMIENARVPAHYFKSYDVALRAARIYNGLVISRIEPLTYPDLAAEMADLLLRLEESQWVICMGVHEDTLVISVRTRTRQHRAEQLVQAIIGQDGTAGGHGTMAGGQIPLGGQDPEPIMTRLIAQTLQYFGLAPSISGRPLF